MIESIKEIYLKNFDSLLKEISLYETEENIWKITDGILNSGGNLVLHLNGNLNYFVGALLGNTGYTRDRDREFADKNIPIQKLLDDTLAAKMMMEKTLTALYNEDLLKPFPLDRFGEGKTIEYVLTYLLAHFNYHLGQINYHRRLIK